MSYAWNYAVHRNGLLVTTGSVVLLTAQRPVAERQVGQYYALMNPEGIWDDHETMVCERHQVSPTIVRC